MSRKLLLVMGVVLLSACGGGGGSSSPPPAPASTAPTPAPAPGFSNGTFAPYEDFEHLCQNPRAGTDANGSPFPDAVGTTTDENNWLRSWSNELYLWYDEIEDENPANSTTSAYFNLMKTFALTPSGAEQDRFHFTFPTDEWLALSQSGISGGYGATFALIATRPPRQAVVAYTEPNTPATAPVIDLKRGVSILEVDGVDLVNATTSADIDTLNAGLFPGDNETHSFVIQELDGTTRSITMTSTRITSNPVQNVSTVETDSGVVGYMTFNDHIATAELQLIDAINQLTALQVNELVLDLRYNGGGFLDIANEMAFMVAGSVATSGQVFEELQFNDKHTIINPVTGAILTPTPFHTTAAGFSAPGGSPLPSLNLERVFILTGPGTCSASEAIINSLRGINIEVVQVGATTCGKPYGFYPFDNCGTTYFSIQFRGVNDKGFGDYTDGFSPVNTAQTEGVPVPGCFVSDDFTRQLGDPLESRFRAALQYMEDGSCPTMVSSFGNQVGARISTHPLSSIDGEVIKPITGRILVQ